MPAMRSLKVMQIRTAEFAHIQPLATSGMISITQRFSNVDFGNDNNACSHSSKTMLGVTDIFSSAVEFCSQRSISQTVITFIK